MRRNKTLWTGGLAAALAFTPSIASATTTDSDTEAAALDHITVLATTDTHGTILDYDYFTGEEFGASNPDNARGMERLSTAITEIRDQEGAESVLLLDNGDANQGNPLATVYHANRGDGTVDPVAAVYNHLDYDAGVVGNHEYNYGLDDLDQYEDNLDMALLGANVIEDATGDVYHTPWTMVTKETAQGDPVDIAVIGVVTPGVRIWDRLHVDGVLTFEDPVESLQKWVPEAEEAGADVVIVLAHTGLDNPGYEWDPADLEENVATSIAENVDGIDVIVGGHSHQTNNAQVYLETPSGRQVLFTQPGYHARFASWVTIHLDEGADGSPEVVWEDSAKPAAETLQASRYEKDPEIAAVIEDWHNETLAWVATVVAQATEDMPAASSRYEDTAILDFIQKVQTDEVARALEGDAEYADVPILSIAAPFSRTAVFTEGDVTVADMAALYIYDNTLMAVEMTGAEVRDYLEYAARYYEQVEPDTEITDWDDVTNAAYPDVPNGIPDYAYDAMSGINYHINISKPLGDRIENLSYDDGTPVGDDDRFVVALNNYRQSGGSGYPHVVDADIVYNEQMAIRDLMIDWAIAEQVIDPADFFVENWSVSASSVEDPEPVTGNVFELSNDWTSGSVDLTFKYGRVGDEVLVGDWDGDGTDTLGVRRGHTFYLNNELVGGNADSEFKYGRDNDEVLVGDWDGDGTDTLGVRRGHTFYLMNTLQGGDAEQEFKYGRDNDEVLIGDWDGTDGDTITVRRDTTFFVNNELVGGNADTSYAYGRTGDTALAGDFDGDGNDTVLLIRGNVFYVNNALVGGPAESTLEFGHEGDTFLVGDWDGDGIDTPGVNHVN